MGAKVSRTDFEWTYTEEPHASRRKEILREFEELQFNFETRLGNRFLFIKFFTFRKISRDQETLWGRSQI